MNKFEKIISKIDHNISIKKADRQAYTAAFDTIRNKILHKMEDVDPVFKKIYAGPSLFGSYITNDRLNKPDEFDVHFLLQLPYYKHINLKRDNLRPGYVKICLSTVLNLMKEDRSHADTYETFSEFVNSWKYLCRNDMQNWLEAVLTEALELLNYSITSDTGERYELIYLRRGTAHTIKAISNGTLKISIDFVPALKFDAKNDWLAQRTFPPNVKEKLWFAVPKPTVGPICGRNLTFSICVPQMERHLLHDKYNMKSSLRLFKSLRIKMCVSRLKSYYIRSLYLYENLKQPDDFWKKPPGFILIHMIEVLLYYLYRRNIPFYWSPSMNLISNLNDYQVQDIIEKFENVKTILKSYYHQPQIGEKTVCRLFGKANESLSLQNAQ